MRSLDVLILKNAPQCDVEVKLGPFACRQGLSHTLTAKVFQRAYNALLIILRKNYMTGLPSVSPGV